MKILRATGVALAASGLALLPAPAASAQTFWSDEAREDISFTYFGVRVTCTLTAYSELSIGRGPLGGNPQSVLNYRTALTDPDPQCLDALIELTAGVVYDRGRPGLLPESSTARGDSNVVFGTAIVNDFVVTADGLHSAGFRCDESLFCSAFFETKPK